MHSDANNVTRRFARQVRQVAVAAALAFASAAGAWNDFHFTSTNANAGPSTPAGGFTNVICYANGSLGPYNCGGTNYVAGNGMMFFSGGNQAAVNTIAGSPYLVYDLGGTGVLQAFTTVYIGNFDYIDIDFGGATVIQTSGSAQTVTINVFSDTGRTALIGTTSVSVPSGTPTAVAVSGGTKFKSATISFPSAIVWGANHFLIQETPPGPIVTTGSASSITATTATLGGTANDNGALTTVTFDHGTTTGYGTNLGATPGTVGAGTGTTNVSASLTGLTCNTTYHFRVKGVNAAGTVNGNDASFTTLACPPVDLCPGPGATTLAGSVTTTDWCDLGNGEGLTIAPGVTYQTNHRPAITFSGGTVSHLTNYGHIVQDGPNFPIIYATATLSGDLTNDGGTFSFINGANSAIQLFPGSSVANIRNVNGGQILGQWEGLHLSGVTLTGAEGIVNAGTISAAGNYGIYLLDANFSGGGGIHNSGTISGNSRGIHLSGTTSIPGGITNSGTIAGPPAGHALLANYSLTKIDITGTTARFVSDVYATDTDVTVKAGSTFANDNAFDVKTFTVEATATFNFGDGMKTVLTRDGVTVSGDFTNAGTVRVVGGSVPLVTGHYVQTTSGTYRTDAQPLSKLYVSSATLPSHAKIDVVTGNDCAGISIGQWRSVLHATTFASDGTFAVTDDCTAMDFVGSVGGPDLYITAVAPNAAPTAGSVLLAGTAQVGQSLSGSYAYADADGDPQDTGAGGTSFRFVRSSDNSVATTGDNVDVALGGTGGTAQGFALVASDVARHFFYCVTPRASTGAIAGSESCSAASVAVAKGSQAIAFGAAPALALAGTGSVSATGGASGNAVVFTSLTASTCSVAGSTVTALAAGPCTIAANQAGNAAYEAAPQVTLAIAVARAPQAIAFGPAPALVFGGTATVSATGGASGNPVTFTSLTAATCSVAGNTVTALAAGPCTIAADQAGGSNHDAAPQITLAIAIAKAPQAVAFGPATALVYGGTASVSATGGASGNPVTFTSLTASTCSVAGNTVTALAAGPCTIAADQAGGSNHDAAPQVTLPLAIARAPQAIVFGRAPLLAVDQSVIVGANGGASGQPVALSVATPATCRLVGSALSGLTAGTCTIVAEQAGGPNHDPAPTVSQDIPVAPGAQAIAFGPAPTLAVAGTGRLIAHGGSSGNPVTFASLTPALCTVSGDIATGLGSGMCLIAADQAGNANYLAAPQVTQPVLVSQSPPRFALTVTPNPTRFRVPTRLRIEATGTFGPVTGTVEFRAGNDVIAGCGTVAIDAGVATCESALLPLGVRWTVARYAGQGAYTAGASEAVLVNVQPAQADRRRDTNGDGRSSLFLERADGGLHLATVRGRSISDGQELAAPGSGWQVLHFGDFDGDGRTDVLMSGPEDRLETWMLEGIGTVRKAPVAPLPEGGTIAAVGDFNGDGRTDLLLRATDGALTARTMDGGRLLDLLPLVPPGDHDVLGAVDLDGDGTDDLVLDKGATLRLLIVRGGRAGLTLDIEGPGEGFLLVDTGDFDADGYADLVFARDGALLLWRMGEHGVVQRVTHELKAGWTLAAVTDFDGGFTDELILAGPEGEVAIWSLDHLLMASGTVFRPGAGWRFVQADDYDGDGQRDLLFEGPGGELVAWLFERGQVVARVLVSHPTAWHVIR